MTERSRRWISDRREEHEHTAVIAMCLWDDRKTLPELQEQLAAFPQRFGLPAAKVSVAG